jgi:hypothetical protein
MTEEMRMKRLKFTLVFLSGCVYGIAQQPKVVINEILFQPDASSSDVNRIYDWVELYNAGTLGVSLTGWKITTRTGSAGASARALPSVTLPAGSYLAVRFASGTNVLDFSSGSGTFYTGDNPATPYWNSGTDEAALYSASGIVDFVAWSRSNLTYTPGVAHGDAVTAGIWISGAAVVTDAIGQTGELIRALAVGTSLGRDAASTDTDSPWDFDAHGGKNAVDISIGRQNLDFISIRINNSAAPAGHAEVDGPRTAAPSVGTNKKWTVMLYLNGANNLQAYFAQTVNQIANAGGTTTDVNFVVMAAALQYQIPGFDGNMRGLITAQGLSPIPDSVFQPKQDMGDPTSLAGFISWTKQNFPANHYALILGGHGDSWKYYGPDERFKGTRGDPDFLYMGELSQALSGNHFDLIAFHACMMASIEVAWQLQPFTDWFVASEQIMPAPGFNYAVLVSDLTAHSDWGGKDLGMSLVNGYKTRYSAPADSFFAQIESLSLIDESKLAALVGDVSSLAKQLRIGVPLLNDKDDPSDNVQIAISKDAQLAFRFFDNNLMDLDDFAKRVRDDTKIPDCAKLSAKSVVNDIETGGVVVLEQHNATVGNLHGLNIYMPIFRTGGPHLLIGGPTGAETSDTYDYPLHSRVTDGSSPIAIYAPNHDLLPLNVRDMEAPQDASGARAWLLRKDEWPSVATPNFGFVKDTVWSQFLERYYHPVADNHIVKAVAPNGDVINAINLNFIGGPCSNGNDFITAPMGSTIYLSGAGSSDADMSPNVPIKRDFVATTISSDPKQAKIDMANLFGAYLYFGQADTPATFTPLHYMWDLDGNAGCTGSCVQPTEVPKGSDAALKATTHMDQDQVRDVSTYDQKDVDLETTAIMCEQAGQREINLIPWDDNHLFTYHNTILDATYVHPQTDQQWSEVKCVTAPGGVGFDDAPPNWLVGDKFAIFSNPGVSNYPYTVTVSGGIKAVLNGGTTLVGTGQSAANPASAQVLTDPSTGLLKMDVTALAAGPATLTAHPLGTSITQTYNMTIGAAPNPAPTDLQVPFPATIDQSFGVPGTPISAVVKSGSQPVKNVWVTFQTFNIATNLGFFAGYSDHPNIMFNYGRGTQVQTDATGTATANIFQGLPGPVSITVSAAGLSKTVNFTISGTVNTTPSTLTMSGVPLVVPVGQPSSITATANARVGPAPGANVLFTVITGNLKIAGSTDGNKSVTIKADANGVAVMNFTALDPTPVQLTVEVPGFKTTVVFAVDHNAVGTPLPPTPSGVSPASGTGQTQTLSFSFTDPRGYPDLGVMNVLINNFLDGRSACYIAYSQPQNVLYLVNDTGTALLSGIALNGAGSISNSQCTISGAGSSAVGVGNTLKLTLNITFGAGFTGNKVIYTAARDAVENNSGWFPSGVWQVPGGSQATTTAVVGMSPGDGFGLSRQYTFTFADTKSFQDIGVVNILINDYLNGISACYLAYSRPANALYLVNDSGTGLLPAILLNGTAGTLSNSQCSIAGVGSSASGTGNTLTLTLNMSFGNGFSGGRIFYLAARDASEANNTGWQSLGAWVVQ